MKLFSTIASLAIATAHPSGVPHEHDENACGMPFSDTSRVDEIVISSYHIHVLFPKEPSLSALAHKLLDDTVEKFKIPRCQRPYNDHYDHACSFGVDEEPAGPWYVPQWSIFVLPDQVEAISQYVKRHRGILDVMIHPNSGCGLLDHAHWASWSGTQWPLYHFIFNPKRQRPDSWRPPHNSHGLDNDVEDPRDVPALEADAEASERM